MESDTSSEQRGGASQVRSKSEAARRMRGKIASAARCLRGKIASAARWLRGEIASAARWLRGTIASAARWLRGKIASAAPPDRAAPAQQKARVWGSEIGECWCTSTSGSKGAQLATLSAFDDPHVAPSPKALWRSWRDGAHEGRDGDAAGGQWPRRARLDGTTTARRRAVATTRATRRHGDGTTAGSGHGRRAARPTPPGHPL